MSASKASILILLLLAFIAANLPFLIERILLIIKPKSGTKAFPWRLVELTLLYLLTGALALALESRQGSIYPQNWEFYAITYCLFLVFAYPGFVYRYLWRGR